jgi:hypothetical protein
LFQTRYQAICFACCTAGCEESVSNVGGGGR